MGPDGKPLCVLLFGASGQVGHELRLRLAAESSLHCPERAEVDLANAEQLRSVVRTLSPDVLINAAAYTAVDRAEQDAELAMAVNAVAPGIMAEEAAAAGACMVHYSTDYIFDGHGSVPYTEEESGNPLSQYGKSKLAGEQAVTDACRRHIIIRTSWVYGTHGANFLKTILRLAGERDSLNVVADQVGAPTSASLIADVTCEVLSSMASATEDDRRWGIYNLTPDGIASWHSYARYLVDEASRKGFELSLTAADIRPITSEEYPAAAPRPKFSVLDNSKVKNVFDVRLPDWQSDVSGVLTKLAGLQT